MCICYNDTHCDDFMLILYLHTYNIYHPKMHLFLSFVTLSLFIQHITAKKVMLFPDFTVNKPPLKHLPKKTFFIRFLFMCIIRQNFLNFNLLKALVDTFLLKLPQFVLIIQKLAKRKMQKKRKSFWIFISYLHRWNAVSLWKILCQKRNCKTQIIIYKQKIYQLQCFYICF